MSFTYLQDHIYKEFFGELGLCHGKIFSPLGIPKALPQHIGCFLTDFLPVLVIFENLTSIQHFNP